MPDDELRYSVVLTDESQPECPCYGDWEPRREQCASWDAELSAEAFAELCEDLGLRAECCNQGTQGPAGFERHHWTPAYSFHSDDYSAWVTPWTPAVKAAALAAIADQKPEDMPVLGGPTVSVVWVPLWGDDWPLVEQMLERSFGSENEGWDDIQPIRSIDLDAERKALAALEAAAQEKPHG